MCLGRFFPPKTEIPVETTTNQKLLGYKDKSSAIVRTLKIIHV
jgi:hypothetical protein